jgi:uncharacterized protein
LKVCLLVTLTLAVTHAARPCFAEPPDADPRYEVWDRVLIPAADGTALSATLVKPKEGPQRRPALLTLDIYTDPAAFLARAKEAADHGYVGVIADTRGKRLSPGPIVPYEHEGADADAVVEWIARQPWSDGQVGMRGGSYSGFSAWAATKHLPAALKTIAVSAAAIPGFGLPMYNNVFLNANYAWAFYVADSKLLDTAVYGDSKRWDALPLKWFASGQAYRNIDVIDGTPNPWLHRWLEHPAYDGYWQAMVPYRQDFAHINIPVLTITGYYDDGQVSALEYVREHYQYNPQAEHYVVIGPYDHFGTHRPQKAPILRGYPIDPVAQFDTPELIYQWMDFVMRGGARPSLLKDRINFEVMGANQWQHAPSLAAMAAREQTLYFSAAKRDGRYGLQSVRPKRPTTLLQSVDLADRTVYHNNHYYPDPLIEEHLDHLTELAFVSEPFRRAQTISGAFSGLLRVTLNKRDADLGVTVFEELPDGRLFHLAYWFGRASYAKNPQVRNLTVPGEEATIPFATSLVSRLVQPGSRLLVLLDVNMNPFAQVNYGTGADVSTESVADAGPPLEVRWHTGSLIRVPLGR